MKRLLVALLGLTFLTAAPVTGAPGAPAKEEVVYAHLAADGTPNRVFVVNAFPGSDGLITDFGDYKQVVNLTNTDRLTHTDDRVQISTKPGDFFYQGELANTELPWLISLEYVLNGRILPAADVRGQDGDFTLRIKVRQNPQVDPVFFENYMLQLTVNLDGQYFSNIISDGATLASSGSTTAVNLTALPGKEPDFEITAQATNAHVGRIQAAALPFEMMMELPDSSEYLGDLVELQDAIALLADGVGDFTSGVTELDSAGQPIGSGANSLATNAQVISDGFAKLAAGRREFDSGLRQYNTGVQEFSSGMVDLADGLEELSAGVSKLASGGSELATGMGEYSAGMAQFSAGLQRAADGSGALVLGMQGLEQGLLALVQAGKGGDSSLIAGSGAILAGLDGLAEGLALLLATLDGLIDGLTASRDALSASSETIGTIATNLRSATPGGTTVPEGNTEAAELLNYMNDQGVALATENGKLAGISDGLTEQIGYLTELRVKIATMSKGAADLAAQYGLFHAGLGNYVGGVECSWLSVTGTNANTVIPAGCPVPPNTPGLRAGVEKLGGGLTTLAEGSAELAAGAAELATGTAQLSGGLNELNAGTSQFPGQADQIRDAAGLLADGGDALLDGHSQLLAGDKEFGSGLKSYATGADTFASGIGRFLEGLGLLGAGGSELSSGANTLRDETADMDQQMADRFDEALADFLPQDFTLVSFADERNTSIERVQFVYMIDAQVEPAPEPPAPEPAVEKSWWDRILDLFR